MQSLLNAAGDYSSLAQNVHVYAFAAGEVLAAGAERFHALLSPEERDRLGRLRVETARAEYLAARGVLRELLGRTLGTDPAGIRFTQGPYGKPSVAWPDWPAIEFNVSHSAGKVAIAFAAGRQLGLDVEAHDAESATEEVVALVFTEEERRQLAALPPELRLRGFFCGWTRKEAFMKATGRGFSLDLQTFSVSLDPRLPPALRLPPEYQGQPWHLQSLDLWPGFEAALVTSGEECPVRVMRL